MRFEDDVALVQSILQDYIQRNPNLDKLESAQTGESVRDKIMGIVTRLAIVKERAHKVQSSWTDARAEQFIRYVGECVKRVLVSKMGDDDRIPEVIEALALEAQKFHP